MTEASPRIRVLVVDDHPAVQKGICDLLACYPDMEVVGMAEDGFSALEAAKSLSFDVMLLDVSLPGLSGIEVARKLRHSIPQLRIIMLAGFDVELVAKTLEESGYGCLLKRDVPTMLVQAIRAVYQGERWLGVSTTDK